MMTLAPNIDDSMVTGCLRFTGSQALLKRDAKTHAAISTTGAPLGPDNLYHIKLEGKVKEMRRLGQVCGPGVSDKDIDKQDHSRPNLTVQPDTPPPPPMQDAGIPQFTPPTMNMVDAALPADAAVTVPVPGPDGEHPAPPPAGSAGSSAMVPPAGAAPPPPPPPQPVPEGSR
jgi:hypothetical protein